MRTTHAPLGDEGGAPHPGAELDCGPCRSALLEAFRAPVRLPGEPYPRPAEHEFRMPGDGCLEPELCTRADPCPVCSPEPDEPGLAVHETKTSVLPDDRYFDSRFPQRGVWAVSCSCGWSRKGLFGTHPGVQTPLPPNVQEAETLARQWADYHKNHPTKEI